MKSDAMPRDEHGESSNGARCDPRKLTPAERRWVADLQEVLLRCPPGLELVTIGDARLTVIDKAKAHLSLHDGIGNLNGANLCRVNSRCRIHGVSG